MDQHLVHEGPRRFGKGGDIVQPKCQDNILAEDGTLFKGTLTN
jgi:hypothetical protein